MSEYETRPNPYLKWTLPFVVIAAGVGVFMFLKSTKPEVAKTPRENIGRLVEVIEAKAELHSLEVTAQGKVVPARQVTLQAEVGGRVQWQTANLVPGGRVAAGAPLVRLDARDYTLAVQQQEAQVDRAKLELELERGRKKIAEREWNLLGEAAGEAEPDGLALREPQLRTARVTLEAAKSGLERAKLAVAKTAIRAPFNAMVQAESVEIGQLVGPQTQIATLVGTDAAWVQVSVPVAELRWLKVPGINAKPGEGAAARVWQEVGDQRVQRAGHVVRLLGDLDPAGGLARLLVEVDDPFGASDGAEIPLLLGAFVHVAIDAGSVEGVIEVPRLALREGDQMYVMTDDGALDVRGVKVRWRYPETVLISQGIRPGERVVVSELSDPVRGMKLRLPAAQPAAAPEAKLETPGADAQVAQ